MCMSLMKVLEKLEGDKHQDFLIEAIGRLLKINSSFVHCKLSELVRNKWSLGNAELPKTLLDMLLQSSHQRYIN